MMASHLENMRSFPHGNESGTAIPGVGTLVAEPSSLIGSRQAKSKLALSRAMQTLNVAWKRVVGSKWARFDNEEDIDP